MKEIKAVLFDLDGTLVDTAVQISCVLNMIRRQRGYGDVDIGLVRRSVSLGAEAMIQICLEDALVNLPADLRTFRTLLSLSPCRLDDIYPGVPEALEALAPHVALAIVTNKPELLACVLLESVEISRWFGVVVGGDTAVSPKPSAAPIVYALAALGCTPEEALMVGDSDVDASASTAAGCRFALFTGGYGVRMRADIEAEFEFASFSTLVDFVLPSCSPV